MQLERKVLYRWKSIIYILFLFLVFSLASCSFKDNILLETHSDNEVTLMSELKRTDYFRPGALEHILEGELNRKGQAVGFHYDQLPTKKGEIIDGTKTNPNDYGVYEAKITVEGVEKTSNRGISSFFPDTWDTQDVVDAINEAYEMKQFISGNTYEG